MTTWVPVPGWEGCYEISRDGRVRSVKRTVMRRDGRPYPVRSRLLKCYRRRRTTCVTLTRPGRREVRYVTGLVREAFGDDAY
jgi:hypothetical protein